MSLAMPAGEAASANAAPAVPELGFDPDALRAKYRQERDVRLRSDGISQYVEVAGDFRHYVDDPHVEPGFTRAPLNDESRRADHRRRLRRADGRRRACARPASTASASSRRAATSAAPGTGTAIPARNATSRATSICRCSRRPDYIPKEKYAFAPEIREHAQRIGRDLRSLPTAPVSRPRSRELRWLEDEKPVADHDKPRRPHEGAPRRDVERSAQPAEAARHSRHRQLQGPQLPHQPLGLRLYRRRYDRQPAQACRQTRRDHRHRRDGDPVRAASRQTCQAALRLSAHAIVGRSARQQAD